MTFTSEPAEPRKPILPGYAADPGLPANRRQGRRIFFWVVAACLIYGVAFTLYSGRAMLALVAPLPLMALVLIWALPETRTSPTRTQVVLTWAFFTALVIWPNYLAFAPPGLPWITMQRLTGSPLVLTLLICVSVSKEYREKLGKALSVTPIIWQVWLVFVGIQVLSIAFSVNKSFSVDKFIVAQTSWTAMFFLSVYVFLKPGRVERMAMLLWALVIPLGIIAYFEWKAARILWVGHIPTWLTIDDPSVQKTLASHVRAADGTYRTQATFTNSLGLGEYLALIFPFVLQFMAGEYKWWIKVLAGLTLPLILFITYTTGSRLSAVGCLMSIVLMSTAWAITRWRADRGSLLAPAYFAALPFAMAFLGFLILFWARLHDLVLGGGSTKYSTQSRQDQIRLAVPKLIHHPWGYGIGMATQTVGYTTQQGSLTLDSYFITVAIEYGIQGFIVFYGFIAMCAIFAARFFFWSDAKQREYRMLWPLAAALTNFFVIKSVFSEEENHAIIFMYVGMIVALGARIKADLDAKGMKVSQTRGPMQILFGDNF